MIKDGEGTVLQRFDYYPFGSESRVWTVGTNTPQPALRYRFGGKEIAGQKVSVSTGAPAAAAGSPYLDFGARVYDPRTAAWLSQDPLSEKYYSISPYAYCAGNPVNLVDIKGDKIIFVNGLLAAGSPKGGESYWGGKYSPFVVRAITILSDTHTVFLDVKHKWYSTAKKRYKEGYQYAKDNIQSLVSDIGERETFKFISHSMGAAYAEGMASFLIESGYTVEMMFHFSPYQAAFIKNNRYRPKYSNY